MESKTPAQRGFEKKSERLFFSVEPSFMEFVEILHAENVLTKSQASACNRLALRMGYASIAALADKVGLAQLLEGPK